MLKIVSTDASIICRTLQYDENVFHKALKHVVKGESRFHIIHGDNNYDLLYSLNNDLVPPQAIQEGRQLLPPYLNYDENDHSTLYLDMFKEYHSVIFEELNEYSIVLTKILLRDTDCDIFIQDERIRWFIRDHKRLHIVDVLPDEKQMNAIRCQDHLSIGYAKGDYRYTSATPLFHDVFVFQWLIDIPLQNIRYVEVAFGMTVGIGGLLAHYKRFTNAFEKKGWKTLLKENGTRYDASMLDKYFNMNVHAPDSNEANTLYVPNTLPLIITYFISHCSAEFDDTILSDSFIQELNEYKEAIIGKKKMLGILLRGTDYITANFQGTRKMATVQQMLPVIHEWMDQEGFDGIFLATEDQDILDVMKTEFPDKIRVIAQQRYRVSDFTDVKLIADLEKKNNSGKEYDAALEDTTVNYFYALYLLSQCDSFLCSGYCNGWEVVNNFNHGRFRKKYLFRSNQ